jgi:hypothetical protein
MMVALTPRAGAREGSRPADRASAGAYAYPFQNKALTPQARVRDVISRLTLDEKVGLLHQFSAAVIRLGIPQFRTGTEGLHGVSWLGKATVFPQNTGMAMTWDPALMSKAGNVVGQEARAYNSVDARFNGVDIWGPVVDLAPHGSVAAGITVTLKNQTVPAGTKPEAVVLRSGYDSRPQDISWGPNQFSRFGAIDRDRGSLMLSAVTYPARSSARPVTCALTDKKGHPTGLAEITASAGGFIEGQTSGDSNRAWNCTIRATGAGNGDVYVKATTDNGLSYTTRVVIQGQTAENAFTVRHEAELFDSSGNIGGAASNLRADDVHGDDVGLQMNRVRDGDWAAYDKIDFRGTTRADLTLDYVKESTEPATITVRADDPVNGTVLGRMTVRGDQDLDSAADYQNPVYHWRQATVPITAPRGVHNLYFVFDVSPRIPDTDISNTYGAVPGWLDLGVNWFKIKPKA